MKKTSFPVLSEQIEIRQFANGLRTYVLPRRGTEAVTMQAWVETGSIHEGKYLGAGLSHFLEHMVFQGTREYPGNQISEKIASFGGELNAATSAEYTYFYFNLPPACLKEGLTMLDSMIREPLLPEKQFDSEREVILHELAMYEDSPIHNLFETLRRNTLRKHPLRFSTGGLPDLLKQVTREDMLEYHARRYRPGRVYYVVTGDIEPEQVFDILEKRTGSWQMGDLEEMILPEEAPCLFRRRVQTEFPAPQAYYSAAWQSPGVIRRDHIAVSAFSDILGNGNSSRLYEELVKKRMLAQDILFYSHALSAIGYSGAAAIAETGKMPELSRRTFDIVQKFAEEGPKAEELECLRNNQRADYLRALETNDGIAQVIGKTVLHYGSPEAADHYLPALDALTKEDLIRVGKKYFSENAATVVEQYPTGTLRSRNKETDPAKKRAPQLTRLKSGQKLLFLEDHALPLVNFNILMPGGILNEDRDQAGLTSLLAETLACGCARYNETDFDRKLELDAIDLDIEAGLSALTVSVTCPSEKTSAAVEMICAMLGEPEFPETAVKRERENLLSSMKTGLMKPETAAKELMRKNLFGKHPFGITRRERLKTIARLKGEDLRNFFFEKCLSAPGTVFGFSGDLTCGEAKKWTETIIGACRWNRYEAPEYPQTEFPDAERRETAYLPRQQAVVLTALPGVKRGTEDADILNLVRVDASSMASKLFQEVRNRQGLVYYAHFSSQPGFGFDGCMGYCGATSPEGTAELEKIFRAEIRRLAGTGLSKREFENARRTLLFQLGNLMQTPEELLAALTAAEFTGFGWEYIWNRKTLLEGMTHKDFTSRVKKLFSGKKPVTALILPEPEKGAPKK